MELKKKISFFAVLSLVFVFAAGSAFAGGGGPPSNISYDLGSYSVTGDVVLFSYYDIRTMAQGGPGLTDNYFTIVNEDEDRWENVHVRVRTGQCSVELLDFDVLLSPADVFTFDLLQDPEGDTVFASCDTATLVASQFPVDANGCFVLDSGTFGNQLSLIVECGDCRDGSTITTEEALESTRWGYVEAIGEIEFYNVDTASDCTNNCCEIDIEAGQHNLWTLYDGGDCSTSSVDSDLFGRVYYAKFDASQNLMRLAMANGNSSTDTLANEPLVHRPCYSDASPGCSSGDGELENPNGNGFAYDDASTSPQGAQDLNRCFYTADIMGNTNINRVGAAATFGATIADSNSSAGSRNGNVDQLESVIAAINDGFDKNEALSHYFFIPGQGQTRFVLTFPLQHFIDQTIEITKEDRYDTEENRCTISAQKFISPGLPGEVSLAGEVTIIDVHSSSDNCDFNEGWVEYELNVSSDGPGRTDYDPGVIGLVVNYGDGAAAEVIAVAPMQWDN